MAIANTTIRLKRSEVSGNVPSLLDSGELAINTADGLLFYKDPSNVIKSISTGSRTNSFSTINVSSTLLIATSNTDILSIVGNGAIFVTGDSFTDTITINVNNGTTSQKGVVQLYNGTDSTSTSLAATANSVNAVHNLANTAYYLALNANTGGGGGGGSSNTVIASSYKIQEYSATAGQTTFTVTGGYTVNCISVYVNGILLNESDYTATDGNTVTLILPASLGDNVSIAKWYFDSTAYLSAVQQYDQFTASSNQSTFTANTHYTPGYIKVYRNGILLEDSEFVANNGTLVTLTHAASNNDIVTLHYWGSTALNTTPIYADVSYASNTANLAISIAQNASNTANIFISNLQYANLLSLSASTSSNTANQVLDTFSSSTYRTVKYAIQVSSGSEYQSSEIMLLHDGTTSYVTEYGLIVTGSTLASYDSDLSGGQCRLLISPTNNINTIKFVKTSITV